MTELAERCTGPQTRVALPEATQRRLLVAALLIGDALALAAGFAVAYGLRFHWLAGMFQPGSAAPGLYARLVAMLIPAWLIVFALFHLYDERYLLAGTREYALLFNACTVGTMVVVAFSFLSPTFVIARGWLVLAWLCGFLAAGLWRFVLRRIVRQLRAHGHFVSAALIVGVNEEARALAEQFAHSPTSGVRLVGFISGDGDGRLSRAGLEQDWDGEDLALTPAPLPGLEEGNAQTPSSRVVERMEWGPADQEGLAGVPVLGQVDDLERLVEEHGIRELIVATSALSRPKLLQVFQTFGASKQVAMRMSSGLLEIMTTGVQVKEIGPVSLLSVNQVRLTGFDIVLKTVLDYAVTVPGLIILSPLWLSIALAIKLDSPGPVVYRRRVLGVGGRPFDAFKFRTMYVDGDAILAAHPELQAQLRENHKIKDDPRVTRVGRILRKYSLDEFPQLINVLLRQMSLVGPRMISPPELEKYGKWGMNLLTIPPGITGLWQVSGRADVSYEERVQLDMYYIRNYTIWLDLQILLRTIPAVLKGKGAY